MMMGMPLMMTEVMRIMMQKSDPFLALDAKGGVKSGGEKIKKT